MIAALITALIYVCLVVMAVYLVFWVMDQIGIALPAQVVKIIWVIVALVVLLILVTRVLPIAGINVG